MGWRDGEFRKFKTWLLTESSEKFNEEDVLHELAWRAFQKGYETGWASSKDYDPKWDAD